MWWGHQIPVWYDNEGNEYCTETFEEAKKLAGHSDIYQDPDVLDTWFSSGIWPIGTLGWPEKNSFMNRYYPTSVLVTGFDIIFFWVARMIMMEMNIAQKLSKKLKNYQGTVIYIKILMCSILGFLPVFGLLEHLDGLKKTAS